LQKDFYAVFSNLFFVVVVGFVHNILDFPDDTVSSNLGFAAARYAGFPLCFSYDQNLYDACSVATCSFGLVGRAWRRNSADFLLSDYEAQSVCSLNIET